MTRLVLQRYSQSVLNIGGTKHHAVAIGHGDASTTPRFWADAKLLVLMLSRLGRRPSDVSETRCLSRIARYTQL